MRHFDAILRIQLVNVKQKGGPIGKKITVRKPGTIPSFYKSNI